MSYKIQKTDAEWRAQLTPAEYEILRNKGTERAFTGAYWDKNEGANIFAAPAGHRYLTSVSKYDSQWLAQLHATYCQTKRLYPCRFFPWYAMYRSGLCKLWWAFRACV